jgi:membrane protein implicated in regulation of membrane protease activity
VTVWWYVGVGYVTLMVLFCVVWARALPRPENSSKAIKRFEQFRGIRRVLSNAFKPKPADPDLDRLLDDLDRAA